MKAQLIPLSHLFLGLLPLGFVLVVFYKWALDWKKLIYASGRMLVQLMIIGYFLTFIFTRKELYITLPLLLIMMSISGWIALYNIQDLRRDHYKYVWISLVLGALPNLFLTTMVLIPHSPWYDPAFIIPLAGMVFTQSMNTVGIASERYQKEILTVSPEQAVGSALKAALIPITNSFMAVGMVSIPGMMTGQILAGVDPLIAVRYQILIMTMMMGSGALTSFFYLYFIKNLTQDNR